MTDEQLLTIFRFLDRACDSVRDCEQRISEIAVLCSIVLYSPNRRPNV